MNLKHSQVTGEIIKSFYAVYNSLGYGFLERVYENAMVLELREAGFSVQQQRPISVYYKGKVVGEYFADLLVDNLVLVELKAAAKIVEAHEAQLINYLRATNVEVGLLLNFGEKPDHKRKLFNNDQKPLLSVLFDQ
jgi:GxxExxY protein